MWWYIKGLTKDNLPLLGIWAAIFVPGVGFAATGDCMLGWILIAISILLLIFVLGRNAFNVIPPIPHAIKRSKTVWGLWFTGDRHLDLVYKGSSIKKILLMEPNSKSFEKVVELSSANRDTAISQIINITKKAIDNKIEVKWYFAPILNSSVTIYDRLANSEPSSSKAYCIVSILEKDVPPEDRTLVFRRNRGKQASKKYFKDQVKRFTDIWNNDDMSRVPSPEEYAEGI